MSFASPDERHRTGELTFIRRRPPQRSTSEIRWSQLARHVIICVEDAFPEGTARRLEAAEPRDCFAIIDTALDVGQGSRFLRSPSIWSELRSEFVAPSGGDYAVLAYHIAPTHAHVLLREAKRFSLEATVERWKSFALSASNDLRGSGRWIWAPGYYDTTLQEPDEIEAARIAVNLHKPMPASDAHGR